MKHFSMKELECKCGKCQMPPEVSDNLNALVERVLDPLRERYGKPIYVNSGYRCLNHNKAVGGVANSQHCKGQAADITAGSPEENLKLARLIIEGRDWDQVILYVPNGGSTSSPTDKLKPQFLHVTWKADGANRRKIYKKVLGGAPIYTPLSPADIMNH